MKKDNPIINTIEKRILVIGNSCSGKSTLAGLLASVLDVPFIELDSLNLEENWVSLAEKGSEELTSTTSDEVKAQVATVSITAPLPHIF